MPLWTADRSVDAVMAGAWGHLAAYEDSTAGREVLVLEGPKLTGAGEPAAPPQESPSARASTTAACCGSYWNGPGGDGLLHQRAATRYGEIIAQEKFAAATASRQSFMSITGRTRALSRGGLGG